MDRGRRIGIVVNLLTYRVRLRHADRVPPTGPLVVVANHQHLMDGAVLFGCLPRRVSFLIKSEAVKGPLGWLLTNVGQYSIVRGTPDREPLLQALAQLKAGGVIGIVPEGTRGAGNVDSVYAGAGWLAARAGSVVVPVAVRGTVRPAGARLGQSISHRSRLELLTLCVNAVSDDVMAHADLLQSQLFPADWDEVPEAENMPGRKKELPVNNSATRSLAIPNQGR